jgi:hypothetical protein
MSLLQVDNSLRVFKLKPTCVSDDDKKMIIPFIDETHTFKRLVIKMIEKKVLDVINQQQISIHEHIQLCIMSIGFEDYYAKTMLKRFEKNDDCWKMQSISEWLTGWFDDIIEQM